MVVDKCLQRAKWHGDFVSLINFEAATPKEISKWKK